VLENRVHRKISVRDREREIERERGGGRSFVMCNVHLIWLGSSGQEDQMGESCGTSEGEEKYVQSSGAETSRKGRNRRKMGV
jgi:hypothetical protein